MILSKLLDDELTSRDFIVGRCDFSLLHWTFSFYKWNLSPLFIDLGDGVAGRDDDIFVNLTSLGLNRGRRDFSPLCGICVLMKTYF